MTTKELIDFPQKIKPEKKKRLMRVDELPSIFWIREFGFGKATLVSSIEGNVVRSASCSFVLDEKNSLNQIVHWSIDRKTWHSFFVEE